MRTALLLGLSLLALATGAHSEAVLPMDVGGRVLAIDSDGVKGIGYQWPAVYFESHFKGDKVSLHLDDDANNFNVIVDDHALMLLKKPGHTVINLDNLGAGPHTIRLEKRSETQYATGFFQGFFVPDAADVLPATPRTREIEFIGDSLTVGYGNTSAFTQCTKDEIFETTDSQEGFGPLTAKHFNADYQVNAFSGLGMVRNYDGHEHPKYHMPMLYERALFDDERPPLEEGWTWTNPWHPQIVVIGIGGNDFSTPLHPDEPWKTEADLRADYVKTYTGFVRMIRKKNPDALIVLATPPDRQEGYSGGTDDVFKAIKAGGDTNIDRVTLSELQSTGCNGHPNIHSDADVANFYIAYFEAHPEVWHGK